MIKNNVLSALQTFSLYAILLTLPFLIQLNGILIGLLVLFHLIEANFTERWARLKQNPLVLLFVLFYGFTALSLLYSENTGENGFALEQRLPLLLLPLIFASSPLSEEQSRQVFQVFVLSCTLNAFVFLGITFYYQESTVHFFLMRHLEEVSPYLNTHRVFLSLLAFFAMLLAAQATYAYFQTKNWLKSLLFLLAFIVLNIFIISATSRALLLAYPLVGGVWVVYTLLHLKQGRWIVISSFVMGLLLLVYIFTQLPDSRQMFIDIYQSDQGEAPHATGGRQRFRIWRDAVEIIKENFWIGVGTGDVRDELVKQYQKSGFTYAAEQRLNPHSQYFETFLSWGVLGFGFLLVFFALPLYQAWNKKKFILVLFLVLFELVCFTDILLTTHTTIVLYAVFVPLLLFSKNI